ncbi:universal stress protein [Sagittula sp. SSi028]|uniref:universal stress protein n=1 Tax=Sagittula sp. SSi028 TaxID=3400636 RepID=UPI003AF5596D
MFHKIVVPIDLAHTSSLKKALEMAADLAHQHKAEVIYVGVTSSSPGSVAHSPEEFGTKLTDFATGQAQKGFATSAKTIVAADPRTDTDKHLIAAIKELGADLVVMQTHLPNVADYIWAGHGVSVASHVTASVFLVRD